MPTNTSRQRKSLATSLVAHYRSMEGLARDLNLHQVFLGEKSAVLGIITRSTDISVIREYQEAERALFGQVTRLENEPEPVAPTRCSECGGLVDDWRYMHCSACRALYPTEKRSDLSTNPNFPPKGRDRVTERLRDGFEMIDDDDR